MASSFMMRSDDLGVALFVFARDPEQFYTTYNQTVSQDLVELGFTKSYNKPVATYQGPNCNYAPRP
eukprot:m.93577 g.93577  ORF g.93577 m.93577 type:complete len:66 (+) comp51198_c0_seq16:598-795(+)